MRIILTCCGRCAQTAAPCVRVRRLRSLDTFSEPAPEPEAKEPAPAEPAVVSPKNSDYYYVPWFNTPYHRRLRVVATQPRERSVNQHRVACPAAVAHVRFWAPLQDTCWKHLKDIELEASGSYWYLATCNSCAERLQLRLKTGRARAHLGCITGQNVRICGRVHPESEINFVGLLSSAQRVSKTHYRRHVSAYLAFASRNLIELDRDINSACNDMFAD